MIEKPKRPKQPNIQDRQPPRTLQELINRYDLDNTKIYDFLDELVELLNTEKESIDTSINDLNNNKVNKSGDEMTGQLNMQSNSLRFGTTGNIFWKEDGYGDKFRVIPNFGNSGENNKLIIQSTTGGAGEDPQNWKDLAYIHADTGLIELAGEIKFNNINDYALIRKVRKINGVNYNVNFGIGANQSARIEFQDANQSNLGVLEVRASGIYNGLSGKKLAEQSTGWTNATLSSYITGTVRYIKIGNIVIINFSDIQVKSNLSHNVILASGLPTSTVYQMTVLDNFDSPGGMRVAVNPSGQIVDHYSNNKVSSNGYYGTLIYVTNQ